MSARILHCLLGPGKGRGSDSLVNAQPSDLEYRPVTTEYDNQSLQSTHSSIAMSSFEPFRVSGPDHLNASNAYSLSPLLHASTSPAGLHYGSPDNGSHLEPPRSGATMRPTFPRNTTDDSAGLYTLLAISRSNERLLPAHLSSAPPSIREISQRAREPTLSLHHGL